MSNSYDFYGEDRRDEKRTRKKNSKNSKNSKVYLQNYIYGQLDEDQFMNTLDEEDDNYVG